jgi:leucyl/phenylalanyl-tRNA--protein transferase
MHEKLSPELIINAYSKGIFPMGDDFGQIRWYSPNPRCIIQLDNFHISKRLSRTYRSKAFDLKINTSFSDIVRLCADRKPTWINQEILNAYSQLYDLGLAHSVEAFYNNDLVGGLYGVSLKGAFMGESMFHKMTDASKICLVYLVERLKQNGYILLDCQFITSHLSQFGAINISQEKYLQMLNEALKLNCKFN